MKIAGKVEVALTGPFTVDGVVIKDADGDSPVLARNHQHERDILSEVCRILNAAHEKGLV